MYRQGFGIGAATGLLSVDNLWEQPLRRAQSYGLAVLSGRLSGGYVGCWTDKHEDYVHVYDLQANGDKEEAPCLSAGFRMERVATAADVIELPALKMRHFADLEEALTTAAGSIGHAGPDPARTGLLLVLLVLLVPPVLP